MSRPVLPPGTTSAESGSGSLPAIDALGEEGMMRFWAVYQRTGPKLAAHLFGGEKFPKYTNAASSIANYASNRATAMSCAERGDEHGAELYNGIADWIAQSLPEIARNVVLPEQTVTAIRNSVRGEPFLTRRAILKGRRAILKGAR